MKYEPTTRGQNFYALDSNLRERFRRLDADEFARRDSLLASFGEWVGEAVDAEAEYTDRHGRPTLAAYDRDGNVVNQIRYNPAWEAVSREVFRRGFVGLNYGEEPAAFMTTFVMGYLLSQSDVSLHCQATVTGAVAYVLDRFAPSDVRERYLADLIRMDGAALTGGTWATELHGGSDVGATTTVARPAGGGFHLEGLKWFTSNASGGPSLATARPEGAAPGPRGLGLYLVPTVTPDGRPNPMRIRRLKDKLGTCGIATAEIELDNTWAVEVAPPPLGLRLMMEALAFSRVHNAMAAVGLSRRAFLEAMSFASHRVAFGAPITRFPMVQQELVKMLVAAESDLDLALAAAVAFDDFHQRLRASPPSPESLDDRAQAWLRLVTALAKYQTAENANCVCRGAIELIGGNAYTYDLATPRLLRDAQATTVWEGPANIQALEVLRVLEERHDGFTPYERRIEAICAAAPEPLADLACAVKTALAACAQAVAIIRRDSVARQHHARRLMALMAETLAAALLLGTASDDYAAGDARKAIVARLFVEQRLMTPLRRGIAEGAHWSSLYFEALVGYEAIPVTTERSQPVRAATS